MRGIAYARCSTDDAKQDVNFQLTALRRYCAAYGWQHDEEFEYASGFKGDQPRLAAVIEKIRLKQYDFIAVYSMDRFSRESPHKTNEILSRIVHQYKCRFISLIDGIDSEDAVKWDVVRHLFVYFANMYSRNLSEKVKAGIENKKEKGEYSGGRPRKDIDPVRLAEIRRQSLSVRKATESYNNGLSRKDRISKSRMAQVLTEQAGRAE